MKHLKQLLTAALAMLLALVVATPAWAAGTGTITITPPTGTQADATNEYKIYKVFDADGDGTNISYKLAKGTSLTGDMATYFDVDSAGNVTAKAAAKDANGELTAGAIAAIAAYIDGDSPVATVTSTGTANAVASNLPNGYYYITTSTGTVVTIDSTNPNATVEDKNTVPDVKKTITGLEDQIGSFDDAGKNAIAQVGKKVTYKAEVTFGNGSKNVKFHDVMGTGLTYNDDVTVTGIASDKYEVLATPEGDDTITIVFADGIAKDAKATITYSATVNADALTVDFANNTAKVTYGDKNNSTPPSDTKVYSAKISVNKKDGKNTEDTSDDTPLQGAGFKLKNSDGKYYKLDNGVVTWVDTEAGGDEHTSDADGKVPAFTGLASGTYTLVETTVPSGFNKAADQAVTVAEKDVTAENLVQAKDIINNKGVELPSTGGIGTTIFYTVGGLMVVGAIIALITKKRVNSIEG